MFPSRRSFIVSSAAVTAGFVGLRRLFADPATQPATRPAGRYGAIVPDPEKILDLPPGFEYRVFSRTGQVMDDALRVPGKHDGMAAFPGPREGLVTLIRNHEISSGHGPIGAFGSRFELVGKVSPGKIYDPGFGKPCMGGTTTLVYNTRDRMLERHFLSLAGTVHNCAGGPTPWGSWISCEETVVRADGKEYERDHGYNFEVPVNNAEIGLVDPVPLKAMGRFNHEAIAVDPTSGVVYQTEDRSEGLIYRFIPSTKGTLAEGGRLQALKVRDRSSCDTRNWERPDGFPPGQAVEVEWVDMEDIESPTDELRLWGFYAKGCARFARGEGMWYGNNAVYFACTNGGNRKQGQIFRYTPSPAEATTGEASQPGKLELFIEPNDSDLMQNADNLCVAPWGDVVFSEDGAGENFLRLVTPDGQIHTIARNALNESELAGCCFSPDGSTLFVNIQNPGLSIAMTGPWRA